MVSVVGVPIAFVGSGERLEDLEPFHPDRVVSRLLGMGDVLSLIEKAEAAIDVEDAREARAEAAARTTSRSRTSATSCGRSARWGRSSQILGMMPGIGQPEAAGGSEAGREAAESGRGDHRLDDADERRRHDLINGSRRKRIARGSGTTVEEVNRLLKQFVQMRRC